ncbi:MAG TPA: VOC family protein [Actinomycetota bacterium]|jgi:catechol 2,3-dioxygenase-like lactoylglutathione lyase family enzyme|nr:VOC family protein [Actinomycetota bacterium]
MIKTEGLTHIHLIVRDLSQSTNFYQRVFGMEEMFREGPHLIFLRTPGSRDTITLNDEPDQGDRRAGDSGGILHFGFRLKDDADLDQAVEEVLASGGKLVRSGEHAPGEPFAYVADQDGYVIEL